MTGDAIRNRAQPGRQLGRFRKILLASRRCCFPLRPAPRAALTNQACGWKTVVAYTYLPDGAVPERAGKLASATRGDTPSSLGPTERYSFSPFTVSAANVGTPFISHGYVGTDVATVTAGQGALPPQTSLEYDAAPYERRGTTSNARCGNGNSGGCELKRTFGVGSLQPGLHAYAVTSVTDSCVANPNSCSAGTVVSQMTTLAHQHESLPSAMTLTVETGYKDKRDNWTRTIFNSPTSIPYGAPPEVAEKRWGSNQAGSSYLLRESYVYQYARSLIQLPSVTYRKSVVSGSSTDAYSSVNFVPDTNLVSYNFKAGWTRDLTGSPSYVTSVTVFSYDASNRLIRTDGPCTFDWAGGCVEAVHPVTDYVYWPDNETSNRRRRLQEVRRFPNGYPLPSPLVTRYEEYDERGNPTRIIDPNSAVVTKLRYVDGLVTSRIVDSAPSNSPRETMFGYDNGELYWVRHPGGNYEVFCHRKNAPGNVSAACDTTNGSFTKEIQFKAKSADLNGATWSEKIEYVYWPQGALKSQIFRDSCSASCQQTSGEIRRRITTDEDVQGRPTLTRVGCDDPASCSTSGYSFKTAYNRTDGVAGIGRPYNNAPDWCGGVAGDQPISRACAALSYDAMDRVKQLVEFPTPMAGDDVKVCFAYDLIDQRRRDEARAAA